MKLYVPFREDYAVQPLNSLSGTYDADAGGAWLRSIEAFHRRKDAVAFMDDLCRRAKHKFRYKIVVFDHSR